MTEPTDINVVTYLDAINRCITSTGADPVTVADPTLDSDVALAAGFLNVWNMTVQSMGWAWNTEEKFSLALNADDTISVPANTLSISSAYWADTGATALVTQRGLRLYDQIDHTYTFDAAVQVDMLVRLDWDDLPQPVRNLIATQAMYEFQAKKQGSGLIAQQDSGVLKQLWAVVEQCEDSARPSNQVGGNLSVLRQLYGSGLRRNRGAF